MNIIDWLAQDHERIRYKVVEIRKHLSQRDLKGRMRELIEAIEVHENVEENMLFPVIEALPVDSPARKLLPLNRRMHKRLWFRLSKVNDCSNRQERFFELQQTFFAFAASAEKHFANEERTLFPAIRQEIPARDLEELGQKIHDKFSKFDVLQN